ncbi:hypothetical protein GMMP15_1530031 [Candidatus Magnetomoraceae bacterium gMMP-15]
MKKDNTIKIKDIFKQCPHCSGYIPINASICEQCKKKVGKIDKWGYAKKPFDWKSYVLCFLSWLGLFLYLERILFK